MEIKFNQEFEDALREIVTIGAGNAATSLSQMLGKKIDVTVPKVHFEPVSKSPEIFGGAEIPVTAVCICVTGDISGVILFSFRQDCDAELSALLVGSDMDDSSESKELASSAIKEAATILTGSYLNAMHKLLKVNTSMLSPSLTKDMAGAVVANVLVDTVQDASVAIIVDTEFKVVDEKVQVYFFFIPDVFSMDKIKKLVGLE